MAHNCHCKSITLACGLSWSGTAECRVSALPAMAALLFLITTATSASHWSADKFCNHRDRQFAGLGDCEVAKTCAAQWESRSWIVEDLVVCDMLNHYIHPG